MLTIGVNTAYVRMPGTVHHGYSLINHYVDWVAGSGAFPLLIPPLEDRAFIEKALDRVDAMLFIGGVDYPPAFYGEELHPETQRTRLRPEFDLALMRETLERDLPLLGVCGGCQLLAIASKGKLIQHLDNASDVHTGGRSHDAEVLSDGYFSACARVSAGSHFQVNSFHHQAVSPEAPGEKTRITARAFDGSVEVIERQSAAPQIGVQFHPERMMDFRDGFFRNWLGMIR